MSIDPFADFDPTPYLTAPRLPLQTLITVGKALGLRVPDDAGIQVKKRAERLAEGVEEAEDAMVVRLRQTNKVSPKLAIALDNGVDSVWALLRLRLLAWLHYKREGLDFLDHDEELTIDMAVVRDKIARAEALATRIFGEGGLEMLNSRYPEQAQLTANVIELINDDELEAELLELAGEELLPILRRCQVAYEQMVQDRAGVDTTPLTDLRKVRAKLQRLIVRYSTAVLGLLDEDEPETRAVIEDALRPMVTLRPERAGGSKAEDPGEDGEDADPEAAGDEAEDEAPAAE